jgi:sec-independent protein translocase protein TatA
MGTLGVQEMIVIFIVALVLFGPKKLPELGKTIGKALTEFRRASTDLKATFEREMHTLERENEALKDATHAAASEIYEHASHQLSDFSSLEAEQRTALIPSTVGASEVPGAESNGTTETAQLSLPLPELAPAIEGTVARVSPAQPEEAHEVASAVDTHLVPETTQHS